MIKSLNLFCRLTMIACFCAVLVPVQASDSPNLLQSYKILEEREGQVRLSFDFERNISKDNVEVKYIDNYIQLKFKNSYTLETSKFVDGVGPDINKLFILQATPDILIARVILKGGKAEKFSTGAVLTTENNHLEYLMKSNVVAAPLEKALSLDEKVPVKNVATAGVNSLFSEVYMKKLTVISVFLMLFLVIAFGVKKLAFKRKSLFTKDKVLRHLSTYNLDSKKSLVLMEVHGEEILIGVTPENITMIKVVSEKKTTVSPQPVIENKVAKNEKISEAELANNKLAIQKLTEEPEKIKKVGSSNTVNQNTTIASPVPISLEAQKASVSKILNLIKSKANIGEETESNEEQIAEPVPVKTKLVSSPSGTKVNPYAKFDEYVNKQDQKESTVKEKTENLDNTISDVTEMIRDKLQTMQTIQKDVV